MCSTAELSAPREKANRGAGHFKTFFPTASISGGPKSGNGRHDFVRDLLVNLLETGLGTGLGLGPESFEMHRMSVFDQDAMRAREADMPSEGFKCSPDAHRHDGGVGFDHGQPDAGSGRLQLSVARAGALGKENDGTAGQQLVENGPQSGCSTSVAVDWHGLHFAQD